jgi:hypothetical protein
MNRVVFILFVCGLLFAGFEGAADAAGLVILSESHDVHARLAYAADAHEHSDDGEESHGHFCHCTVHGVALFLELAELDFSSAGRSRCPYRMQASSRGDPPLLRPPIV